MTLYETTVKEDETYVKSYKTLKELIEELKDSDTKVVKAEQVKIDEEKIKKVIEEKLQEAYSELLEYHGISSGDIGAFQQVEIDKAEEKLVERVANWIESRIHHP